MANRDLYQYKKNNKKPPKPFKFQKEAIKNVLKSFKKHKKGKLIMACGTGKTYTSLKINEQLRSKITLYVVPSISLIDQTFDYQFAVTYFLKYLGSNLKGIHMYHKV